MSKLYKPYLKADLDLGFVGFHTSVMNNSYERDVCDYIRLDWYFFKWNGHFNLYKPGKDSV